MLILNHSLKGDYIKRLGSNYDVESLRSVFDTLQYQTRIFEDLTLKQFLKELKTIRALDHLKYDSFFCVVMSHGNDKEQVIFADNKPLLKTHIVMEFSPRYCEALNSKPKIFLFQACRGTVGEIIKKENDERSIDEKFLYDRENFVDKSSEQRIRFPVSTSKDNLDIFIGNSTVNQVVSYRNSTIGSFFIQSFCSVMQSCSTMEFQHIMMEVRRSVCLFSNEYIQCTEDTNRLQKRVYF